MARQKNQKWKKQLAGTLVISLLVGGVAFALLQSQAKLTGNSIQTDSAGLMISTDNLNYASSTSGYDFAHVVPGFQASPAKPLFLQNTGSAPLALKLSAATPPSNPDGIDLDKVKVVLTPHDPVTDQAETSQSFSLESLIDMPDGLPVSSPSALGSQDRQRFDIQIAMDADAVNGSGAALSNLDLTFTGVGTSVQ